MNNLHSPRKTESTLSLVDKRSIWEVDRTPPPMPPPPDSPSLNPVLANPSRSPTRTPFVARDTGRHGLSESFASSSSTDEKLLDVLHTLKLLKDSHKVVEDSVNEALIEFGGLANRSKDNAVALNNLQERAKKTQESVFSSECSVRNGMIQIQNMLETQKESQRAQTLITDGLLDSLKSVTRQLKCLEQESTDGKDMSRLAALIDQHTTAIIKDIHSSQHTTEMLLSQLQAEIKSFKEPSNSNDSLLVLDKLNEVLSQTKESQDNLHSSSLQELQKGMAQHLADTMQNLKCLQADLKAFTEKNSTSTIQSLVTSLDRKVTLLLETSELERQKLPGLAKLENLITKIDSKVDLVNQSSDKQSKKLDSIQLLQMTVDDLCSSLYQRLDSIQSTQTQIASEEAIDDIRSTLGSLEKRIVANARSASPTPSQETTQLKQFDKIEQSIAKLDASMQCLSTDCHSASLSEIKAATESHSASLTEIKSIVATDLEKNSKQIELTEGHLQRLQNSISSIQISPQLESLRVDLNFLKATVSNSNQQNILDKLASQITQAMQDNGAQLRGLANSLEKLQSSGKKDPPREQFDELLTKVEKLHSHRDKELLTRVEILQSNGRNELATELLKLQSGSRELTKALENLHSASTKDLLAKLETLHSAGHKDLVSAIEAVGIKSKEELSSVFEKIESLRLNQDVSSEIQKIRETVLELKAQDLATQLTTIQQVLGAFKDETLKPISDIQANVNSLIDLQYGSTTRRDHMDSNVQGLQSFIEQKLSDLESSKDQRILQLEADNKELLAKFKALGSLEEERTQSASTLKDLQVEITELQNVKNNLASEITSMKAELKIRAEEFDRIEQRALAFEHKLSQTILERSKGILGSATMAVINSKGGASTPLAVSNSPGKRDNSPAPLSNGDSKENDITVAKRGSPMLAHGKNRSISLFVNNQSYVSN